MPQYKLDNNKIFEETEVVQFAKKSNLSVPEYINKYDGRLEKVKIDLSKYETSEDISSTIANIANNVGRYEDDVNKELAQILYVNPLKSMERQYTEASSFISRTIGSQGATKNMEGNAEYYYTGFGSDRKRVSNYVNSEQQDVENYFDKQKYDQYQNYLETNQVNLNNVSEEDISVAMYNVKQRRQKDYINQIKSKTKRKQALKDYEDGVYDMFVELKTDKNTTTSSTNTTITTKDGGETNFSYDAKELINPNTTSSATFIPDFKEAKKDDKEKRGGGKKNANTEIKKALYQQAMVTMGPLQANAILAQGGLTVTERKNIVDIQQGGGKVDAFWEKFQSNNTTIVKQAVDNLKINKTSLETYKSEILAHAVEIKKKVEALDTSDPDYNNKLTDYISELNALGEAETNGINIYNDQIDQFNTILDNYTKINNNINNYDEVIKSLMMDYDFASRANLSLEIGMLETLNFVTGLLSVSESAVDDVTDSLGEDYSEEDVINKINPTFFRQVNQGMLDYTESVKQYKESSLPVSYRWEDMNSSNFGEALSEVFANNSFTILSSLAYGGALRYGKGLITTKQATSALGNTFLAVEAGGYLSRQDIARKNADKNITFADNMLAQADITPENLMFYQNQKDDALRVLTQGEYEKAFAAVSYGTVAKYFEKFGTMRYVRNFSMANKSTGGFLTKTMKLGYDVTFNAATEYVEEAGTLASHNLIDNIGGDNNSIFKGLDADFNVNVLVTTLGIQGPSTVRNLTMNIYDVGTTVNKKIANRKRAAKIISFQKEFDAIKDETGFAANSQRADLRNEINNLIEEAALSFTFDMAEIAQMGDSVKIIKEPEITWAIKI